MNKAGQRSDLGQTKVAQETNKQTAHYSQLTCVEHNVLNLILLQYLEEEGFEEEVVLTPDVAVVKVAKEKIMNEKTSTHASCRRVCTTT